MTFIPSTTDGNNYWQYPIYPGDGYGGGSNGTTLTWTAPTEPVQVLLSLDEVNVLRDASRENPALRAVLNKLADCIEVDVDFDEDDDAAGIRTGS